MPAATERAGSAAPVLWLGLVLLLGLLLVLRWPGPGWLATDFQRLLPALAVDPWEARASAAAAASYEGQLLLLARGAGAAGFLQQAREQLVAAGFAAADFEQQQAAAWRQLGALQQPHAIGLATAADRELLASDPEGYFTRLRNLLYSPLGGPWLNGLPRDPLGLWRSFSLAAAPQPPAGEFELLALQVPAAQRGFGRIEGLYPLYLDLVGQAQRRDLEFRALGAPLYTAYGVQSGQREMTTIGGASLLALLSLLLWALRSGRALLLSLLVVGSGIGGGFALTLLLFQQVHLLALVLGATLVGIAADYAFHYLCHSLLPGWQPADGLGPVFRGLSLSAATSVLGFASLVLLPFPGLQQMGCFMAAGLLASYLSVCLLFPGLYRVAPRGELPRLFRRAPLAGRAPHWLWLLLVLLALPGVLRLQAQDELRDFYAAPQRLQADQQALESLLGSGQDSRFLLLRAADMESLLQREEALRQQLPALRGGVSALVPSAAAQGETIELQRHLLRSGELRGWIESLGLAEAAVSDYLQALEAPFQPLTAAALLAQELPLGSGGFLGCDGGICASWLPLPGTVDSQELQRAVALDGVAVIEPVAQINRLLAQYRGQALVMLPLLALVVAAVLWLSLGWAAALYLLALPLAAALLSFGLLGWLRGSYSIVNLLALLPVAGVALDFAIFRRLATAPSQPAVLLAVSLSALTSLLAFGMLAFSATPIISDFGYSIASGLLFAWLLCWLRPPRGPGDRA